MNKLLWILMVLSVLVGCESLEDTYSDMAEDGPRRYLGKCTDVSVSAGWQRLRVTWVNNVDPVVSNIKITWNSENLAGDTILPKGTTLCEIPHLKDGSYEIKVFGIDEKGNNSLMAISYGRPYTMNHEVVMTFSQVISKHIFVKNRLILFFEEFPENISNIILKYTTAEGIAKELPLGADVINTRYYLLPDAIDPSKKVTLERKGHLEESLDVIPLAPYELTHNRSFTTDFKTALEERYGPVNDVFVESTEELDLDFSINSLEDILYFPNLKKLNLAKNRLQWDDGAGYNILELYGNTSQLYDPEKSLFALNMANKLLGLTVDRYNKHFLPSNVSHLSYVTEKGNPVAPQRAFFDANTWNKTCSVEDAGNFKSYLERLFDGDLNNAWLTESNPSLDIYEIVLDMEEVKAVHGVQVAQRRFDPEVNTEYLYLMPALITIQYSTDRVSWNKATYMEGSILGNTVGELTVIQFPEAWNARYLKFTISDLPYGVNFAITLAEIGIF